MTRNKQKNYLRLKDNSESLDFGRLVAEQDSNLAQYYVLKEKYVARAVNINDPATFFIGPKGVGKSAILQMVRLTAGIPATRIIDIRPDDLAFSALANAQATSKVLSEASTNQWLFKILWDYVLSLEVLKREHTDSNALSNLLGAWFQGKYAREAKKLISMSEGSDYTLTDRILQLIREVEVSGEYAGGKLSAKVITAEERQPTPGTPLQLLSLVNSVAKKLRDRLSNPYMLLIDDLDLYWENTPTQNAFIAALFSSLSHLSRPPSLKAVVALRQNIYDALPLIDRDKFPDFVCPMKWDQASVKEIIERRVTFKFNVTSKEIWGGVFESNAFSEIWNHSNGRPREAIRLASLSVANAVGKAHLSVLKEDLAEATFSFSNERIKEIAGEFAYKYPGLEQVIRKMSGWPKEFPYEKISNLVEQLDFEVQMNEFSAERYSWVRGYASNVKGFIQVLLETQILWIKQSRTDPASPYEPSNQVEVTNERWFAIHPMFAPALGLLGA
jgi:hypothetical protein